MKIGILTLPLHTNYGGILQAYALQTILEHMGHDVIVFNVPERYSGPAYWKYPIRFIKRYFLRKPVIVRYETFYKKTFPMLAKKIVEFRKKYIKEFVVENLSDIDVNNLDCIVVGSDQIWRPCYFKQMWRTSFDNAFLGFTRGWNIKRVAYAASFGVDFWELSEEETRLCKDAVRMFDAVSVREKSGVDLLRNHLKRNAEFVLDPTLLISKKEYETLAENAPQSKGNLFCYLLDKTEDKSNLVELVKKERGLIPFYMKNTLENRITDVKQDVFPSVEEWIRGFIDARFVVTDSFHACVFCIIFQKPFVVITNAERGISRLSSLLSLFHLEKNLITNSNAYKKNGDYSVPVETLKFLDLYKKTSLSYLETVE